MSEEGGVGFDGLVIVGRRGGLIAEASVDKFADVFVAATDVAPVFGFLDESADLFRIERFIGRLGRLGGCGLSGLLHGRGFRGVETAGGIVGRSLVACGGRVRDCRLIMLDRTWRISV